MKKSEEGAGPGIPVTATAPMAAGQSMSPPMTVALPVASLEGVKVVAVSNLVKLALPPLFIASLPKRAIGFSFPRGAEGRLLGTVVLAATALIAFLAYDAVGPLPALVLVWLMGGTAVVMLYNSTVCGLAFIKRMCYNCRLRPIIVEHEAMHLSGIRSEEEVWRLAKQEYTYDGLGLRGDPKIHGFCPIAKRLKENP
jgi:hypothetical protein